MPSAFDGFPCKVLLVCGHLLQNQIPEWASGIAIKCSLLSSCIDLRINSRNEKLHLAGKAESGQCLSFLHSETKAWWDLCGGNNL